MHTCAEMHTHVHAHARTRAHGLTHTCTHRPPGRPHSRLLGLRERPDAPPLLPASRSRRSGGFIVDKPVPAPVNSVCLHFR